MIESYADLLVHYSLKIRPGQRVLVKTSTLAEPFLDPLYTSLLRAGAHVEHLISFENQERLFFDHGNTDQLSQVSSFYKQAVAEFDAIVSIVASHNLKSTATVPQDKKKIAQEASADIRNIFMQRSAKKELAWVLAVHPTHSSAQECGMSLREYRDFVYKACMLHHDDPVSSWTALSNVQSDIVSMLNPVKKMRFIGYQTDLTFSVAGRTWINSDGVHNMPSGEVFSSPVENSVNGTIYFDIPTVYDGKDVEGIQLEIKDGIIQSWEADTGKDVLDRVFSISGARQFGEVAIGTNYSIQTPTKSILFDEKIGGTLHMAVGASYPETGGTNTSAVHWDMIKSMTDGGQIYADDVLIHENGEFVIPEAKSLRTLF